MNRDDLNRRKEALQEAIAEIDDQISELSEIEHLTDVIERTVDRVDELDQNIQRIDDGWKFHRITEFEARLTRLENAVALLNVK